MNVYYLFYIVVKMAFVSIVVFLCMREKTIFFSLSKGVITPPDAYYSFNLNSRRRTRAVLRVFNDKVTFFSFSMRTCTMTIGKCKGGAICNLTRVLCCARRFPR